jgi:hypothetical protein
MADWLPWIAGTALVCLLVGYLLDELHKLMNRVEEEANRADD